MKWISVEEKLPEEDKPVIILLRDGQIFRGTVRKGQSLLEWWYYYGPALTDRMEYVYCGGGGSWMRENPVVAWMPMPELPMPKLPKAEV